MTEDKVMNDLRLTFMEHILSTVRLEISEKNIDDKYLSPEQIETKNWANSKGVNVTITE